MNQLNTIPRLLATLFTVMILLSCLQTPVVGQANLDPIVILYDASHAPQFDADDEDLGLKLMLDSVNASTRYIVHINENSLTEEVLNDVDILIIADPDRNDQFSTSELVAIKEMMANGSSLFLLGDPALGQESNYWDDSFLQDTGDNIAINRVLDGLNVTGVRFSINETSTDTWSDTMFDYDHALNDTRPWVIRLDATTWDTNHPIFRNINELYTMTATLKPLELASGIGFSYDSSFAQYKSGPNSWANYSHPNMTLADYELDPLSYSAVNGTFPSWLSAFEYGSSRMVVVGSTIMFTGRTLDLDNTELQWYYTADNARLFMNIIGWLSEDFAEVPSAIGSMLILSSVILVVGVAFYLLKKIRR
ncbi:MAG: hypothetical protein JW779_05180 [Candidatus Thorarchaeota archaeon]|nr:hypothetical protein [Candidatus Thorarchaeota archaeon]